MLAECYFSKEKVPRHPHHPYCHCLLNSISYNTVLKNAKAFSKYSKYDPYLFNSEGKYPHNKEKLFKSQGYTIGDAKWLQKEIERQALEKYINSDYVLGKLDKEGQRISIRVEISRKDKEGTVSFITGWMVYPNGEIQLTTPYGGK